MKTNDEIRNKITLPLVILRDIEKKGDATCVKNDYAVAQAIKNLESLIDM